MAAEPGPDLWVLVGGVIVEDHVHQLAGRHLGLDRIQKADEFLMPMALHAAADDLAVEHVEGGEQCGGAVALVIVGHPSRPAPASAADRAGCGRAPGFGSSHRPTARSRGPADRHRARQPRAAWAHSRDRWTV